MHKPSKHPDKAPPPQRWDILRVLEWTSEYFQKHHIDSPRACAEILLAQVLKCQRIDLYMKYDQPLDTGELAAFKELIRRRVRREPVAYITQEKGFWSLDLKVTPDVLIPRPETEGVVEAALAFLTQRTEPAQVLDLGTGSGAIVLALAAEQPQHRYFASDRFVNAIDVACHNARNLALDAQVHFFVGDWFHPIRGKFDLIVSNPPYIRSHEIRHLQPEVSVYEPVSALDGGPDGLDAIRVLIGQGFRYLLPGGMLLIETGYDQQQEVEQLIAGCGVYARWEYRMDYSGHPRVACLEVA